MKSSPGEVLRYAHHRRETHPRFFRPAFRLTHSMPLSGHPPILDEIMQAVLAVRSNAKAEMDDIADLIQGSAYDQPTKIL